MALLLALSGCASVRPQKPEVSLADITVKGGNLFESQLGLKLRVRNPNDKDITVDGLRFEMLVGDAVVASGLRGDAFTLPHMSDTVVEVDATARILDLLRAMRATPAVDGRVAYTLRGEALIHDYGSVPFNHRDSISMPKLGQSK